MDWCWASNIGDGVVPKNQEVSDRFPSPESWLHKWGKTEPGSFSFNSNYKGFSIDNFNSGIESCGYDKDWSNSGISQESSFQPSLDYQILGLAEGLESMDDLYLSSIIDDIPGNEEFYNSYGIGPEMENEMAECNGTSTDMSFDIQQKQCPSLKAPLGKVLVPCGLNSSSEQVDEEKCLEESVLEDLGMVMSQMTEKTRLCFRDSLYRLAKNSGQNGVTPNQNGNVSMNIPTWTGEEDKMRLKGKKAKEIETDTNTIDRTIANLLFNKMDVNVNGYPVSTSVSFQDESLGATKLPSYTSNHQQMCSFPQLSGFPSQNEVLIPCQEMSPTRIVPNIQFVENP